MDFHTERKPVVSSPERPTPQLTSTGTSGVPALIGLQRRAGNRAVASLLADGAAPTVQRDGAQSVAGLSGYYESTEDMAEGGRKLTVLFVNVNQRSLVGNYRSFIDHGDGLDAHDSGDVRAERNTTADGIRFDGAGDSGPWMFRFRVHESGGLAGLQRGGVTRPLVVNGVDGVDHVFRRRGSDSAVTSRNVRDADPGDAASVDRERRRGLTPLMLRQLRDGAAEIVDYLRHNPTEGLSLQRTLVRRSLVRRVDEVLARFRGGLRDDARSELMRRLARSRVTFLGERIRADRAVIEARSAVQPDEAGAATFRYRIVFRGIRGGGRAVAGVQMASGSVEVTAYRASTTESSEETVWTRHYGFQEIRVSAAAGGGLQGGIYWKTFDVTSPVEWTQQDFREAEISIFGVQGPNASLSGNAGPLSVNAGECQVYQFEGVSLSAGAKTLELQAEEKTFECSSAVTAGRDEGGATIGQNDEGGLGIEAEAGLGNLESGMGHLHGVPGQDYSDDRQQLPDDPTMSTRGSTDVVPSRSEGGYGVGSARLAEAMQVEISQQLGSYQSLLRDPAVPLRVVGHASSLWRGRSDPVEGNLTLSRERATVAADLIRSVFELGPDRVIDVQFRGDAEARAAGGTTSTDDPAYRRVDVHIGGARPVAIRY